MVINIFALPVVPSRRYLPGRRHPLPFSIPFHGHTVLLQSLCSFTGRRLPPSFLPRLCLSRTAVPSSPVLHRISPFPAEQVSPQANLAPVVHCRPTDAGEISYFRNPRVCRLGGHHGTCRGAMCPEAIRGR
jgi:hypothetical protein